MDRKSFFSLLLLLCIAAVLIGFWYYWGQLSSTAPLLLAFVPDCPLYVLLTLPILAQRIKNGAYSFLVSIGMVKYGLWTVFVLLFHWDAYSLPDFLPISVIFIIGHIGMALVGAALLPKKKITASLAVLVLLWFLANDFADYFLGTVPPIPVRGMGLVRNLTIAASILLTVGFFLYAEKVRDFPPVKFFRWVIGN